MTRTEQAPQVVIVGAGYAGRMAASRLSHVGVPLRLTVIDPQASFVERIRLHQLAAGQRLPERSLGRLLERIGATHVRGRAVGIDPAHQLVEVETAAGPTAVGYDWLIYAPGSRVDLGPARSVAHGVADHVGMLDDPASAGRVREQLATLNAKHGRLLIVGAGLTGIEASTEFAESYPGLRIELVDAHRFEERFSAAGAAHLREALERRGVTLRDRARVVELTDGQARLAGGEALDFDYCLWAGGFQPPALAAESGLPVNARGQVRTDAALRVVGQPHIIAAGDAAEAIVGGQALRMACATAMPMGAHAAEVVSQLVRGQEPQPLRFGFAIRCISLGRRDGLVQFVAPDDTPQERVLTGRAAALTKELICRSTVWGPALERRLGLPVYFWPHGMSAEPSAARRVEGRRERAGQRGLEQDALDD